LRTVDFHERARVAEKNLRGGFDEMRLSRGGGSGKEQASQWTPGHTQARRADLVEVNDRPDCAILTNDLPAKLLFEFRNFPASLFTIQHNLFGNIRYDHGPSLFRRRHL